jgi:hypothetical protein
MLDSLRLLWPVTRFNGDTLRITSSPRFLELRNAKFAVRPNIQTSEQPVLRIFLRETRFRDPI